MSVLLFKGEKSTEELIEGIRMLLAQVAEAEKTLAERGITSSCQTWSDGTFTARFYRNEEICEPKKGSRYV